MCRILRMAWPAPCVPAQAGTQGTRVLARVRGDERKELSDCVQTNMQQIPKANALLVPHFGRAGEGPSLFPPLKTRGGRAEQARQRKENNACRRPTPHLSAFPLPPPPTPRPPPATR